MEQHLDLNRVRVFVEVVDRGSFTAAALALGVPKSSVSRGVARLEKDLGVTLLRRTTRTLTLTDAGRAYADRARAALQELASASDLVSEAGDEPRGLVRMTAPIDASGSMIAAPLAKFLLLYPRIEVDLVLTGRAVDLIGEGIDLAIRAGKLPDSTLIARRVTETRLGLFASGEYLARRGRPRRLEDLTRHECIGYQANTRWTLQHRKGQTASVDIRPRVRTNELIFAIQAAQHGVGIALLPLESAEDRGGDPRLERVLPEWGGVGGAALWLVHPPMRHLPRRVALLRDFLHAELSARVSACKKARGPAE